MIEHLPLGRPDPLGHVYLHEDHADCHHRYGATAAECQPREQFGLRSAKSIILALRIQIPAASYLGQVSPI